MSIIKEIATVRTGVYLKETPDGEAHYLQVKDFQNNALLLHTFPTLTINDKVAKYLLSEGDLLFAAKGFANFCAVYRENWGTAVASSSFLVLKIKDKAKILPEYLSWYLNREDILFFFKNITAGNVMPSISKAMMENLEISIPSVAVQRKIVQLDELCREEEALLEKIKIKRRELVQQTLIQIISKQ